MGCPGTHLFAWQKGVPCQPHVPNTRTGRDPMPSRLGRRRRPALVPSVGHTCWQWPVGGEWGVTSCAGVSFPVVSSDSDSDSDLSSSSLDDRLPPAGVRDPKGNKPWGESGK